ncbi:MAG: M23 family metallopeptidase [Clostridia bacterium]|nr:M23 family metallopeptidase [Clostridia bacterium]
MFHISKIKKGIIHLRIGMKFIVLASIAVIIVVGAILIFYKPTYEVIYNGEFLGYVNNKTELQAKINEYITNNNGNNNLAFTQIQSMPKYEMCLLKREVQTNEEEIYNKIIETGVSYYRYYTIMLNGEAKYNVSTYEETEEIKNKLKEKDTNNLDKITSVEKYDTNLVEFSNVDTCVEGLYEEKPKPVVIQKATYAKSNGSIGSSKNVNNSGNKVNLGISLIKPVSGTISCRFGQQRGYYHTGLDIATSTGTPIKAAADGTVTYAAYHYSYGNLLIVTHANGIQTYYAHCSKLYVSTGATVSQGQVIAAVGSTGNSTGPHLHLEVRVNGTAQNPQNYLY